MNPLVDIIIPSWNGKTFLENCLISLYRQTFTQYRVIIVDNGSDDGTLDFLQSNYPKVKVVALPENMGFCRAVNRGIEAGVSPFVFLLNNDTELAEDCLEQLIHAAHHYSEDFFAPKMLDFANRFILDGAGDGYLRGGAGYRLGTMETDGPMYAESRQVFGACGGAALYRRSMLEETGLLDEDFFAYLEDVDLNLRACRLGYLCRFVPEARVYHIGSATTGSKINPFTVRLSTRNSLYVLIKHYSLPLFFRFFPVICIYQLLWFAFCVKRRQVIPFLQGAMQGVIGMRRLRQKHHALRKKDRLSTMELAQRLSKTEQMVLRSIMFRRREEGKGNGLFLLYKKLFIRKTD